MMKMMMAVVERRVDAPVEFFVLVVLDGTACGVP